jgi:hypothetical protein
MEQVSVPVWRPEANRKKRSGGIAQLGERLHGMQEVSGSIPLTSTNLPTAMWLLSKKVAMNR